MSGNDAKYFQTSKKGEIRDLKEELLSSDPVKKKEAVKKAIAAMTVGKDVSSLFMDIVSCMQTTNIEMKKLVYLYLMNYAKSQPDLAIIAVNTFEKDTKDPNPLIRALAIRTMSCIRVDKILDYLLLPLQNCLKDDDPYVRKTAAISVAKLYDMNPELVHEQGLIESLVKLLGDANPMVVANAVAALGEIEQSAGQRVFEIDRDILHKLLAALNECTEWGQVFILDCLASYTPQKSQEAEVIVERVTPRFQHVNSAVVLSAIKVVMKYMEVITNQDTVKALCKKMSPPLVTLLMSAEPEIQYVALRNINLIIQRRSQVLQGEVKVFFCKYNDPIYVKLEKLEIMVMLANERTIDQILTELKEYATEVDVDFVRRSVRAIGRCAIKLERAAERCVKVILELIQTKVNYVVQEAIVVIKDIFRKYPNKYEATIVTLCENLDTLDEPEAKGSMIWIIGEYADRIESAEELLDSFLETFQDEPAQVQLQLLTATVKLFLKKPTNSQKMVQDVLSMATQDADNPDLRDRGFVYWRLLSTDPEAAKAVVLAEKPKITDDTSALDQNLLVDLIGHISTLASIYHKPPEAFVNRPRMVLPTIAQIQHVEDDTDAYAMESSGPAPPSAHAAAAATGVLDLLGLGLDPELEAQQQAAQPTSVVDLFGNSSSNAGRVQTQPSQKVIVLPAAQGMGMQVSAAFVLRDGQIAVDFDFSNQSPQPLSGFMIQFNNNPFNIKPAEKLNVPSPVNPGQTVNAVLKCMQDAPVSSEGAFQNSFVQMAVKNNVKVHYFQVAVPLHVVLRNDGLVSQQNFMGLWREIPEEVEQSQAISNLSSYDPQVIQTKLTATNLFFVGQRAENTTAIMYFSAKTITDQLLFVELAVDRNTSSCKCSARSGDLTVTRAFFDSLTFLLQN